VTDKEEEKKKKKKEENSTSWPANVDDADDSMCRPPGSYDAMLEMADPGSRGIVGDRR